MIPRVIHFVFGMKADFGGKPFNIVHYLAVKSAREVNRPDRMILHYQYEPTGEWFEKARPYLELHQVVAPAEIHGRPLLHVAHQADIIRLRVLYEQGGIYLDLDTICKRPLDDLLHHQFVIAKEYMPPVYYTFWDRVKNMIRLGRPAALYEQRKIYGLCNAVMLSEPGSAFVSMWLDSYRTFRSSGKDEYWVEHSVKVPYELSKQHPDLLTVLEPEAFHFPGYDPKGLRWLFEKSKDYPDAYLHHLWETNAWEYLKDIDMNAIRNVSNSYHLIARRFVD